MVRVSDPVCARGSHHPNRGTACKEIWTRGGRIVLSLSRNLSGERHSGGKTRATTKAAKRLPWCQTRKRCRSTGCSRGFAGKYWVARLRVVRMAGPASSITRTYPDCCRRSLVCRRRLFVAYARIPSSLLSCDSATRRARSAALVRLLVAKSDDWIYAAGPQSRHQSGSQGNGQQEQSDAQERQRIARAYTE